MANPTDGKWLERNMADLQRYLEVMRKWQIPAHIIVSECCLLGKRSEGTYLAVQDLYMPWLWSVREIQSVAWFSARHAGFPEANLLRAGRRLAVGQAATQLFARVTRNEDDDERTPFGQ